MIRPIHFMLISILIDSFPDYKSKVSQTLILFYSAAGRRVMLDDFTAFSGQFLIHYSMYKIKVEKLHRLKSE